EGEVTLHLAGADLVQVDATGLREATPAPAGRRSRSAVAWRTFRYDQPGASLTLRGQGRAPGPSPEAGGDPAAPATYAGRDGVLRHHFRFQLINWPRTTLPVFLPGGAKLLAARVDGLWLPRLPAGEEDGGSVAVELPVPAESATPQPRLPDAPGTEGHL